MQEIAGSLVKRGAFVEARLGVLILSNLTAGESADPDLLRWSSLTPKWSQYQRCLSACL